MTARDIAFAVSVAIIWGFAFIATEFALQSFSAPQLTALRFILAALPVLFIRRPDVSWGVLIALGSFLFIGQFMMLFFAYKVGMPPGLASVATHTQALFTIILAAVVMAEVPGPRRVFGIVIAFAGLALVAASVDGGGELTYLGLALTLLGALSWSVGNVILKRLGRVDMLALIIWLSVVPPLPALMLSVALGDTPGLADALAAASWKSWLSVLYLGLISTTVAYAVWGRLLNIYPAAQVTPFALFAPCAGVIGSYLVFGETFGPLRATGVVLIFIGVAVTVIGRRGAMRS
tara:strand:+ start:24956 stop:25828 length:873 start_codon:yes stop_codon:yes gene_type:complete